MEADMAVRLGNEGSHIKTKDGLCQLGHNRRGTCSNRHLEGAVECIDEGPQPCWHNLCMSMKKALRK